MHQEAGTQAAPRTAYKHLLRGWERRGREGGGAQGEAGFRGAGQGRGGAAGGGRGAGRGRGRGSEAWEVTSAVTPPGEVTWVFWFWCDQGAVPCKAKGPSTHEQQREAPQAALRLQACSQGRFQSSRVTSTFACTPPSPETECVTASPAAPPFRGPSGYKGRAPLEDLCPLARLRFHVTYRRPRGGPRAETQFL